MWFPYAMYNPRAFGNFSFGWFRVFGRLNANVRIEQAQSVMEAAFTNVRRENVLTSGPGPNRSPEDIARFVEHAAVCPVGRDRPLAAPPSVRAPAVDPGRRSPRWSC